MIFDPLLPDLITFPGLPSSVLYEGAPTIALPHPASYDEQDAVVDCYRIPEQPKPEPRLGASQQQNGELNAEVFGV